MVQPLVLGDMLADHFKAYSRAGYGAVLWPGTAKTAQ